MDDDDNDFRMISFNRPAINDDTNDHVNRVDTPDVLSCVEYRMFWITWDAGQVSLGSGMVVGNHKIMSMSMPDDPNDLHFISSTGWGDVSVSVVFVDLA